MNELELFQKIAVWLLPVVFAITAHEVAHGWVALQFGDRSAQMLGRLTLNPIKHIDPIGTIVVPGVLLVLGGFIMGWAKPVPVTVQNLRNPRRDMAWVALAGPGANLLMGIGWALLIRFALILGSDWEAVARPLILMGAAGILINVMLMVLNLLPIPPLDGGRVLSSLLPPRLAWQLSRIEPYGLFILLGLIATGLLGKLLGPPLGLGIQLLAGITGLSAHQFTLVLGAVL